MRHIRVTVWAENVASDPAAHAIYPKGIHTCLAEGLSEEPGFLARTATLSQPEHGLPDSALDDTDVLIWWGHRAHHEVDDAVVDRIARHVWDGMGLIALHSAHYSKILNRLLGTRCSLQWRNAGERERLWICNPGHPIAAGLPPYFELAHEEMYGEPFAIPEPEELILLSWFQGGEVFRSGCVWTRGSGKIFYFRPGHETHPSYHDPHVKRMLRNAARWLCRPLGRLPIRTGNIPVDNAPEKIEKIRLPPGA